MTTIADRFNVEYGNKLDMNKMITSTKTDGVAFVGRIGGLNGNSGVAGYVEHIAGHSPYPASLLTVALGGSRLLSTYVQQRPFYTAQNVAVLKPIDSNMPLLHRLYYAMCIKANAFRYTAFGREANRTLSTLRLPDAIPEWVDNFEMPDLTEFGQRAGARVWLGDTSNWKSFRVGDLFEITSGKYVPAAQKLPGATPEVTSSSRNNGRSRKLDLKPNSPGGTISVARNGSVGTAFYQPTPYFATDDVRVWKAHKGILTPAEGLFLCAVIGLERYRYSYGRKWNISHMKETHILLPAKDDGSPDWLYMESVISGLPFSTAIA